MASFKKRTVFASLVLVAGLSLTGCSGAGSGTSPVDTVSEAEIGTELTAENFVTRISAAQLRSGSAHLETKIEGQGSTITASADMEFSENSNDLRMHMLMDMPVDEKTSTTAELKLVKGKVYMSLGELTADKWVEVSEDQSGALNIDDLTAQTDPAAQFAAFEGALQSLTKTGGGEKIDGVQTTEYTLALDPEKLLTSTGQIEAIGPEELLALGKSVEYKLYVGPDDLPRRIIMDLGTGISTLDYSKWGEDTDIKAPNRGEITTM